MFLSYKYLGLTRYIIAKRGRKSFGMIGPKHAKKVNGYFAFQY